MEHEIKQLLLEVRNILEMLLPNKVSLSFVCERVDMSRQGLLKKLKNNYEDGYDYWKEGKLIYVSQKTASNLIQTAQRKKNAK